MNNKNDVFMTLSHVSDYEAENKKDKEIIKIFLKKRRKCKLMSQTFLKSIAIRNFKGCREAEYKFSEKTFIYGPNASGKTTIADAFWWLLFNKDSIGNSKFNIRPLDKEGNRIDNVEIEVVAVLEIDGKEIEIKKTQKQKWVKKRSSATKELQGNENLYEIDGYPKSEKEYKERVSEIIEEELFKMLTNPTYFTSLEWKEQRKILMRFANEISDYELAKENPQFVLLLNEIEKATSLEDIHKKYSKALGELKKKQDELPVRIDEAERQKIDIDVAELELAKEDVLGRIKENQNKQVDVSKQVEEYQNLSNGVLEIKFAMSDLEKEANRANDDAKTKLSNLKYKLETRLVAIQTHILNKKNQIQSREKQLEILDADLKKARQEYKEVYNLIIDENSLVCAMCGQRYPDDKQEKIRAEFDGKRKKKLEEITFRGNYVNETIKQEKNSIETDKQALQISQDEEKEIKAQLEDVKKEYESLPSEIDVSESNEYKLLKAQLEEKEALMQRANTSYGIRSELKIEADQLSVELNEIERRISKSELNIQLDERISELQQEQRDTAQKVANQEKMLYLLEEFIRYKMDKISKIINAKFDGISFKLFENQINGGLRECCECTVNGVPYSDLNNGHKIIAGLEIIKALQQLYGVSAPIFIDNAEAISKGNMPRMDCQMIMLVVSSDKNLRVEVA